ncbi:MAG: hypothetical protein U1F11_10950 [Steroidobacteraceae bacterium]
MSFAYALLARGDALGEALRPLAERLQPVAERLDRLSLRERVLVFGAALVLAYIAWQSVLMDPLAARLRSELRLAEARQRAELAASGASLADRDPTVAAVSRERALRGRYLELEAQLSAAARGYVPPEKMSDLLRELLGSQRGLRLVSLRNLPVEALSQLPTGAGAQALARQLAGTATTGTTGAGRERRARPARCPRTPAVPSCTRSRSCWRATSASVVGYLQQLEHLPWRLHWRQLDVATRQYPVNRVRIEIGTLSLSREWMSV